jgi:hypothetical protein
MSWLFSQALVAAYSEGNCLDGEPSAQLKSNPIPHLYSSSAKMTVFCRRSRYGMTCAPLTGNHGEVLLTWFLAGFPVKTLHPPAAVMVSTANSRDSGKKWHGLLARFDLATYSWKTAQSSIFEESEPSLQTFPRWGSMRNGVLYQQKTLEPGILENAPGLLLPTLIKRDSKSAAGAKRSPNAIGTEPLNVILGGRPNPEWAEWFMGWVSGWTELKPLAMDKYHEWLRWHGEFYTNDY